MGSMVKWKLEAVETAFLRMSYGNMTKLVESLKTTLAKYQKAVGEMTVKNREALNRITILETLIKKYTSKVWVVEYHANEEDWRREYFTYKTFDNLEEAASFCTLMIGNHRGAVRMIHPD